ncbi:MAG: internal scaffolding protein [Arizlama microvirus]|nr:MAG: internal scaffolding protein [Arizlama microvirus]
MTNARTQYDERPSLASDLSFEGDKGVTKQSDLKDCDINTIFKRYERTGQLPDMIQKNGSYGDFSAVPDYQEACNIVNHAKIQFESLDVAVRNRFDNDPAKFLAFATDNKNYDEMEKMGLLKPEILAERAAKNAADAKAAADAMKANKEAEYNETLARLRADLNK